MCMMWNLHRAASNSDRLVRSFFDVGFSLLLVAWWWYFHIWAVSRRLCQVLTVCLCVCVGVRAVSLGCAQTLWHVLLVTVSYPRWWLPVYMSSKLPLLRVFRFCWGSELQCAGVAVAVKVVTDVSKHSATALLIVEGPAMCVACPTCWLPCIGYSSCMASQLGIM